MGVKNQFCTTCARTNTESKPRNHQCYKNWKSSDGSSAMEAAVVVEGFKESERMYGIRYHKLIGDGDSSVLSKFWTQIHIKILQSKKLSAKTIC